VNSHDEGDTFSSPL